MLRDKKLVKIPVIKEQNSRIWPSEILSGNSGHPKYYIFNTQICNYLKIKRAKSYVMKLTQWLHPRSADIEKFDPKKSFFKETEIRDDQVDFWPC